ncbi:MULTISPECIES: GntR family transcriptional regulator [Salinivibrio]|uniref:GntR family transcriptional regulator n=1 Tax=Salinivibrio proteolyticus TaxID=334715 RepID=A0ABY7LLT4_9GAMM|nr:MULTISPECIES: GntR family transcriptional regulator [Salinivibrio]WBA16598.1 GntR family transcriptional regulator [Salinivibrio proteolyticus]
MMQFMAIRQQLLEQINSGQLDPGQKLPSERQLAEAFHTTRVTLREALAVLEAEGRIYRLDRRGWFIAPNPWRYNPSDLIDWTTDFAAQGGQFAIQKETTTLASAEMSQQMHLPPFSAIYQAEGVVSSVGVPVGYVRTYLQPDYYPQHQQQTMSEKLSANVTIHQCHWTSRWEALEGAPMAALNVAVGTPALKLERHWLIERAGQLQAIRVDEEWWRQHAIALSSHSR